MIPGDEFDPLLASWHSYPSIFALGHRALKELFSDPVVVEEKVDGSQISFGLFRDGYRIRSKGAQLNILAPEKMFSKAVDIITSLPLTPGWTYLTRLIEQYKTPARWAKAVQHLRDAGKLEHSPKDIGEIMREVWPDIEKECKEDIKDSLYQWAQGQLRRGITNGIPEWYKDQLLVSQFEPEEAAPCST